MGDTGQMCCLTSREPYLSPGNGARQVEFLKGIYPEFQVIRGFSQKILADLLSYDQIHS